ncbi:AMP-binding protein [Salarchaeum sp. JOR-1]|uniref:AMP-binding protein n=1 Tax=Salarchaeum sp. JOR-1 TaxID=2599399 RepID=UPI001198A6B7|nr:AMP-binding protein [Salarchaeum sp. JOR-1]QDX39369.1 long-chain fatty acid--CoA ligase [Salarchaeum sp. JOR-1]
MSSEGGGRVHEHGARPYEWVGAWSERRAMLSPDRTAVLDATTNRTYTYADLDARANRTARLLADYDVTGGERVAVVSRNRPELFDLFFACGKTGGVLAPLSHRLAARELGELLADADPAMLVVEAPFADLVADALEHSGIDPTVRSLPAADADSAAWPELSDGRPADDSRFRVGERSLDDPCLFLHTGGSTGVPKETVLTHGSVLWNSINTITAWGLRADDVTPMVFPLFHTGGWNVLTLPLFHMGGTVAIARTFDAGEVLGLVESQSASVLVAVPAVLRMMTEHEEWASTDLSSLRFAKSGGGPCRDAVLDRWWERDVPLSQGYGLTECGPNNFTMPDGWPREKAGSVGVPAMHVDARVVDDDGCEVGVGEVGELELASPHAGDGYWNAPAESREAFGRTTESDAGGWVSTGDLARVDADGYYYIEGRKKNMFVSGGENVYPAAVENAVADHPKVEEVVVIGVSDAEWGEVGKAVVRGDRSLTLDALEEFLEGRLARFKRPRRLAFVEEMPMSGPSKIDREAIRDRFGD